MCELEPIANILWRLLPLTCCLPAAAVVAGNDEDYEPHGNEHHHRRDFVVVDDDDVRSVAVFGVAPRCGAKCPHSTS